MGTYLGFSVEQMLNYMHRHLTLVTIRSENGEWHVFADGLEHSSKSLMLSVGEAFAPHREEATLEMSQLKDVFERLQLH